MILFYSSNCSHSKMLLENVNRYDKNKTIKLVPIEELKKQNINIETKIRSVPAFMILPSKELLFGKDVFDYLLLPGRGILCGVQNTRLDKNIVDNGNAIDNNIKLSEPNNNDPSAFALNCNKLSDNFSAIEDDDTAIRDDKNYGWDFISNDKNISDGISNVSINYEDVGKKSKMPSIEELMKERDSVKLQ